MLTPLIELSFSKAPARSSIPITLKKKTRQTASLPNAPMELKKRRSVTIVQDTARDIVINNLYPFLNIGSKIKNSECG